MSAANPPLPPVPPPIAPPVARPHNLPPQRTVMQAPTGPRSLFESTPKSTLSARQAAEKARAALHGAVLAVQTAVTTLAAAKKLAAEDPTAAALLDLEGLNSDVVKKFDKLAPPLLDAFLVKEAPPATPA